MTDHSKLVPALAILAAASALALPVQVQAMPSAPAVAAPSDASVVEVANQRRPYQNVNRRNDRGNDTGNAEVERLNQQSLQRAQQGQNSPTPGPDTTSNLNRMSDDAAARGQNMGGPGADALPVAGTSRSVARGVVAPGKRSSSR